MNSFDLSIYNFVISFYSESLTNFLKLMTSFASAIFIVTAVISIFFLFKDKKYFFTFALVSIFGKLINSIIKNIVKRPRPSVFHITHETGYSFPSAHAMIAMIFYGLIIYFICTKLKSKNKKILLTSLLSFIILIVGFSRIYLGVHYASDVIGGYIIGLIYLIVVIKIFIHNKKYADK